MTVLFISDLHLDASRPAATACFLRFLQNEALAAQRLYILGDLFEAWIGDDDTDPHHQQVCAALAAYTGRGKLCYFMPGNRDFLLGQTFLNASGMLLLHDPSLISIAGTSLVITHGDLLCIDDHSYQRFRRIVRNPRVQRIYASLPFSLRCWIVGLARRRSQSAAGSKRPEIMDVNTRAVNRLLRHSGVSRILHGHTHRPGIHRFDLDGKPTLRIVLGDWYTQGSIVVWQDGVPELQQLDFTPSVTAS